MGILSTSRVTGLASGLDTQSLVDDMLSAGKAKINKVKQQKMVLEWKQAYYQEITASLNSFQNKYFSSPGGFAAALGKLGATYDSPYVSISPLEQAKEGSLEIRDIISLASPAIFAGRHQVSAEPALTVNAGGLDGLAGKSLVVTLDGAAKTLTFSDKVYDSGESVMAELASLLTSSFGPGRVGVSLQGDAIRFDAGSSAFSIRMPQTAEENPAGILNFDGFASNRADLTLPLSMAGLASPPLNEEEGASFKINGVSFSFARDASLNQIMNAVNQSAAGVRMSYSSLTDSFTLTAAETGAGSSITAEDTTGSLMASLFGGGSYRAGVDAKVRLCVDGGDEITITRGTNTFDVNGAAIRLLGKAPGDAQENIGVTIKHDVNRLASQISGFVKEYNELLASVTKLTSEKIYQDFNPLTQEEKKGLSEDEAKIWTEKAKSGILKSDPYLTAIASELRSCFYSAVEGLGALDGVGITTGNYSERGQLHLDEEKLKAAFNRDAEGTLALFTKESPVAYSLYGTEAQRKTRFSQNGILSRLSDVIRKNLSSVGKKGALILLVGSPDSQSSGESDCAKRIRGMEDRIKTMEEKLSHDEDKYWAQFTAMETALSRLQAQSEYMANMFKTGK